jgi:predicted Zn finger-like uncharacterized protein
MPQATRLQCPQCGTKTKAATAIPAGSKVRCPKCEHSFRAPDPGGPTTERLPVFDDRDIEPLAELRPLVRSKELVAAKRGGENGYQGLTNAPLPPRSADDALPAAALVGAAGSERSKDQFIGTKGVRFVGPREFTAVAIMVAAGFVVYFCFWFFVDVTREYSKVSAKNEKNKKAVFQGGPVTTPGGPKAPVKGKGQDSPEAPAAFTPQTAAKAVAPAFVTVAHMQVRVSSASVGPVFPGNEQEFLSIVLEVKNISTVATANLPWPRSTMRLKLRDTSFNVYNLVEKSAKDDVAITPGQTVEDRLFFPRTLASADLLLDLIPSATAMPIQFTIPPEFIARTQ